MANNAMKMRKQEKSWGLEKNKFNQLLRIVCVPLFVRTIYSPLVGDLNQFVIVAVSARTPLPFYPHFIYAKHDSPEYNLWNIRVILKCLCRCPHTQQWFKAFLIVVWTTHVCISSIHSSCRKKKCIYSWTLQYAQLKILHLSEAYVQSVFFLRAISCTNCITYGRVIQFILFALCGPFMLLSSSLCITYFFYGIMVAKQSSRENSQYAWFSMACHVQFVAYHGITILSFVVYTRIPIWTMKKQYTN